MQIADPTQTTVLDEMALLLGELSLDGAAILELGCGKAEKTRALANTGRAKEILALEVDSVQHVKNLELSGLPNTRFCIGGAEAIPAEDASFDIVLMFKSLHHVPLEQMDKALQEVARVLKPGGVAWISEPVYAGTFNDILRLFHDEKLVREAAFGAVQKAVKGGLLAIEKQIFFESRGHFDGFEQFDERIIRVTHTDHRLSLELYAQVKERFQRHMTPQGANFLMPQRVDVLKKPA